MDRSNAGAQQFIEALQEDLDPYAVVTTGRSDPPKGKNGSGNATANHTLGRKIREIIGAASLVVVQLDPPRPAIGVEIGWALAMGRYTLMTVSALADNPKIA